MKVNLVLLTKTSNLEDLKEWLEWHLNVCKFSRIHVVDNDSIAGTRELCLSYENVTYEFVSGRVSQYTVYNRIAKQFQSEGSKDWIAFLDDDEYLKFDSTKYSSVQDVIKYYSSKITNLRLLAVRWKFKWPKDPFAVRNKPRMAYCTEEYTKKVMLEMGMQIEINLFKCLISLDGKIHFQSAEDVPCKGHVPIHSKAPCAFLPSKIPVFNNRTLLKKDDLPEDDLEILHCRFTSFDEFKNKNHATIAFRDTKLFPEKIRDLKIIEWFEALKIKNEAQASFFIYFRELHHEQDEY
jgi:hypothetical protein